MELADSSDLAASSLLEIYKITGTRFYLQNKSNNVLLGKQKNRTVDSGQVKFDFSKAAVMLPVYLCLSLSIFRITCAKKRYMCIDFI